MTESRIQEHVQFFKVHMGRALGRSEKADIAITALHFLTLKAGGELKVKDVSIDARTEIYDLLIRDGYLKEMFESACERCGKTIKLCNSLTAFRELPDMTCPDCANRGNPKSGTLRIKYAKAP